MAKSGYDVYLGSCLFPVTPEKIQITINNNNTTVNLINEGEINILKMAGLTDVEFEAEIPQIRQPYAVYKDGFQSAGYFFNIFEQLKTGKKPFQFIVCRRTPANKTLLNTNLKVSLEDYTITEEAGNGFDFKVKFKLKQYREYGTKTVNIKLTTTKPKAAPNRRGKRTIPLHRQRRRPIPLSAVIACGLSLNGSMAAVPSIQSSMTLTVE